MIWITAFGVIFALAFAEYGVRHYRHLTRRAKALRRVLEG
tara:strand:- start:1069 stop:1188 length:120 start_codon:yes stop_codon:yes gene_type:complete